MQADPSPRRWYQFTLAQSFVLTSLLALIWWLSVTWPVRGVEQGPIAYLWPKPVYELVEVWQPPTAQRAIIRGASASALLIAWVLAVAFVRQKRTAARRNLAD